MNPDMTAGSLPIRAEALRCRMALLDSRVEGCDRLPPEVRYDIDVARAHIQLLSAALPLHAPGAPSTVEAGLAAWGRRVADDAAAEAIPAIDAVLDDAFAMLRPFETRTPKA